MPHALFTNADGRVVLRHHKPHKLSQERRALAAIEVDELPKPPKPSAKGKRPVMYVRERGGRKRIEFEEEDAETSVEDLLKEISAKIDVQNELLERIAGK